MNTLRIITDDFTSATDGVVAFAERGLPAAVLLDGLAAATTPEPAAPAASVDTDSRHLAPQAAAQRVAAWARRWGTADVLVKQFDSTLRGPLAAECLAALQASGRQRLLLAPAFPAAGRLSVNGHVMLHGVPVHQTAFAHDPLCPVRSSSVPALFAAAGLPVQMAPDAAGAQALFDRGSHAVMVDIGSEAELQQLAQQFIGDGGLLWAGSTGIVRALAAQVPVATPLVDAGASAGPVRRCWVLVGSRHPLARRQADVLADMLADMLAEVVDKDGPALTVLRTAEAEQQPGSALPDVVRRSAQAVFDGRCDGLVVTGGETAKALAVALKATELRVMREVEPGVPLCLLRWPGGLLPLVTKAGGFGDERTLLRCVQALAAPQAAARPHGESMDPRARP